MDSTFGTKSKGLQLSHVTKIKRLANRVQSTTDFTDGHG
jgi:hypothetical protein